MPHPTAAVLDAAEARLEAALEAPPGPQAARLLAVETIELLDAEGAYRVAEAATASPDDDLVCALTEAAARKGHPDAAFAMADWADDPATRLAWLETAATLGHPGAIARIAEFPDAADVPPPSPDGMLCIHCRRTHGGPPRMRYCPDCRDTAAPWRPDPWAIARAAALLGITRPVVVRRLPDDGSDYDQELRVHRGGAYLGFRVACGNGTFVTTLRPTDDMLRDSVGHEIEIAARLTAEDASHVIWHELAHAMQSDRDPLGADARYRAERDRCAADRERLGLTHLEAHRRHPMEIEANAIGHEHAPTMMLTLPNRRASMPHLDPPHERLAAVVDGRVIPGENAERARRERLQAGRAALEKVRGGEAHIR